MRTVNKIPTDNIEALTRNKKADTKLENYLKTEIESRLSARGKLERQWDDYKRMYEGKPTQEFSDDPIPIRMIEVTVGATACDSLFAQAYDMLFSVTPLVTIRGTKDKEPTAKAMQTLANHVAIDPYTHVRETAVAAMMDTTTLGTGVYYSVWTEHHRKTGVEEVVDRGPECFSVSPRDIIVPESTTDDIQRFRWMSYRQILPEGEFRLRAKQNEWDGDMAHPVGVVDHKGEKDEPVPREVKSADDQMYDIHEVYLYFDYDGDGQDEELLAVWDRTSARLLDLGYCPYDRRPFNISRYQPRPHSFYGIGVMEMYAPYQREITEWHNYRTANAKVANARVWGVKKNSCLYGENFALIPNKPLPFDNPDDLRPFQMGDIYPSAIQAESSAMQLGQQRVGTMTDFSAKPNPGHRTPGITMLSVLQAINKRFMPAFDDMRRALAGAVMQCILRLAERYKTSDRPYVEQYCTKIVGEEDAQLIFAVFDASLQDLEDELTLEMTASTQQINREADRQASAMVMQSLNQYYQQLMQMGMLVVNPQAPPPIKQLATKIADAMTEAMDRFLRTFEQVRDTALFLVHLGDLENGMANQAQPGPGGVGPGLAGGPPPQDMGAAGPSQDMGGNMPAPGDESELF